MRGLRQISSCNRCPLWKDQLEAQEVGTLELDLVEALDEEDVVLESRRRLPLQKKTSILKVLAKLFVSADRHAQARYFVEEVNSYRFFLYRYRVSVYRLIPGIRLTFRKKLQKSLSIYISKKLKKKYKNNIQEMSQKISKNRLLKL